jgi:DNA-binding NtrC family response regulator
MNKIGSPNFAGTLVLIVEDNWHVGNALKKLLMTLGAEVVGPVSNVTEAKRLVLANRPDVASVDVRLRDGELAYGLIESLLEHNIPVVITSGDAVLPERFEKVVKVLPKPFTLSSVQSTLSQVLGPKGQ